MAKRDKNTAAFLSLVFGWFGMHQIYLKKPGRALFFIAALIFIKPSMMGFFVAMMMGFVNALILMMMPQKSFDEKYNEGVNRNQWDRRRDYSRRDYDREKRWENRHNTSTSRRRPQNTTYRRTTVPRATRGNDPVQRKKPNPFKISGVQKYKDYDYEGAIDDFKKALEIDKNDIASHFNIACAYSLTEKADQSFYHLGQAVRNGFSDFDKIKTHDDLAYIRIQPEFEKLMENKFQSASGVKDIPIQDEKDDQLLNQLQKLAELRDKGLITQEEFVKEKAKLSRI